MRSKTRRTFSPEFRLESAQLVVDQNYSMREAALAVGVGNSTIDHVIDEFVATKRSENTKRAYAKDIGDVFDFLAVNQLSELGQLQFHDLVAKLHEHLELLSKYDE